MVANVVSRKTEKIMKKRFILISLATVAFFSCVKPEVDQTIVPENEYNATLTASVPVTKVAIADDNIKLSWTKGDKISVLTSNGVYKTFVYNGESGAEEAEFKGYLDEGETIGGYAIYPANPQHAVNDGVPSLNLPSEYEWNGCEVMGPMVAVVGDEGASFTHAGGLFAFDAKNVPAGAKGFKFSTSAKNVVGVFPYADGVVTAADSEQGSSVTMWFDALEREGDMKFFIPVPVGTYEDFTVSYIASDNSEKSIRSSSSKNVIEAATVKLFTVKVKNDSYYVTAAGSVEADGLSWASATTLDNALAMAEDGDVIHVAAGTYKPQVALDYNGAPEEDGFKNFLIDKNITLIGGYPQTPSEGAEADASLNKTILDGDSKAYHTLIVAAPMASDKRVVINGITVKGGNAANADAKVTLNGNTLNGGQGGGIALLGTSAELNNVTVSDNKAGDAGGVFSAASKIKMTGGCTITSNNATSNGGGARLNSGTDFEMDGCFITGNTAAYAGGLYLYTASGNALSAKIRNTDISGNTATTNWGGAWVRDDSTTHMLEASFDNCTFSGNTAKQGAVVLNENADVTYTSCTFSSNTGSGNGLVNFYENTLAVVDRCTLKENSVGGGVVFILPNGSYKPNVTIINTSFSSNTATGNTGAVWARGDGTGAATTVNIVNSTFCGNNASREGGVFAYVNVTMNLVSNTFKGNSGWAVNNYNSGCTVNSWNNIIDGAKLTNGTIPHKYSIVGTTYYNADGATAEVTPAWNVSTMLGALTTDGVCPLLLPNENPAYTYGMSSTQLQALANDYVSADVLSKDQLGNSRTGNVMGAYVAN